MVDHSLDFLQQIPTRISLGNFNVKTKDDLMSTQRAYDPMSELNGISLFGLMETVDKRIASDPFGFGFAGPNYSQAAIQNNYNFNPLPQFDFINNFMSMLNTFMQMFLQFMNLANNNQNNLNNQGQFAPEANNNIFNNPQQNPINAPQQNPITAPNQPLTGNAFGQQVAKYAENTATAMGSKGWCYKGVANSLAKAGVNVHGASAYMAADQLAQNGKFNEVTVSKNDLKSLPAGAVVVWDKCSGHPHGHISVALGDGREASDHVQTQITNYGPRYRVFMPVA